MSLRMQLVAMACLVGAGLGSGHSHANTPYVFGGRVAQDCEWPNVGRVGGCTATLIREDLVVMAAHCGLSYPVATFDQGKIKAPLVGCWSNPEYSVQTLGSGMDWAYCKIADSSQTRMIPLVPPLRHGELSRLSFPYPATLVGYGLNDLGVPQGKPTSVDTWVHGVDREAHIGGEGADSCQGDSGGPAFVQLRDKSWRVLGITSYGGMCGEGGHYSLFANAVPWIEQQEQSYIANCDFGTRYGCTDLLLDPGGDYGRQGGMCLPGPKLVAQALPDLEWARPAASELIREGQGVVAELEIKDAKRMPWSRLQVELDGQLLHDQPVGDGIFQLDVPALDPGQHELRARLVDDYNKVHHVARRAFRWRVPMDPHTQSLLASLPGVEERPRDQTRACRLVMGQGAGFGGIALGLWLTLGSLRGRRRRI